MADHPEVLPHHIMLIQDTTLHLNRYPRLEFQAQVLLVPQIQCPHPLATTIVPQEEEPEGITNTNQVGTMLDKHTPLPTGTEEV